VKVAMKNEHRGKHGEFVSSTKGGHNHGSHRDHPRGVGHGHMEAGMKEHEGLMREPHGHRPMGMSEVERGRKHPPDEMGMP
jgi:hypothetical protein